MTETSTILPKGLNLISNPRHAKVNLLGSSTQSPCENFKPLLLNFTVDKITEIYPVHYVPNKTSYSNRFVWKLYIYIYIIYYTCI